MLYWTMCVLFPVGRLRVKAEGLATWAVGRVGWGTLLLNKSQRLSPRLYNVHTCR
jgi:hypothetical protein